MKLGVVIALMLAMSINSSSAERWARTQDGKLVILYDNGTWKTTTDTATNVAAAPKKKPEETPQASLLDVVQSDESYDFRKVNWGMSRKQVKSTETQPILRDGLDSLAYQYKLAGLDCTIVYKFTGDKLVNAAYLIEQGHVDPQKFFDDFASLRTYLQRFYGDPLSDQQEWKDEMYKPDRNRWGFAVSIGFMTEKVEWQNKKTRMTLGITGRNHAISTAILCSEVKP
jgi:hypothetical protein